MCGMVGFSGKKDFDLNKIKILMLANMSRGMHSTGMYCDGVVSKQSLHATDFLALYDQELVKSKLFMGHDRHATVGNKTDSKNAHPFEYGDIVGQHNGTLSNHYFLSNDFGFTFSDFDVDSQVLIASLNEDKQSYSALQKFEGAAALIWHDKNIPDRLYCFRNSERPLWRGYSDEGMYISSTEHSLNIIGCKSVREFKTNYLYIIDKGEINVKQSKSVSRKAKNFSKRKPDTTDHTPRSQTCAYPGHYNSYGDYDEYDDYLKENRERNKSCLKPEKKPDSQCDWVRRVTKTVPKMFTQGKWYRIYGTTKDGVYEMLSDSGQKATSNPDNFSPRTKLNVGHIVIAPTSEKSGLLAAGQVLYLRGLDLSEKYIGLTDAILEAMPYDGYTYTWNKGQIRNATAEEIAIIMKNADKQPSDNSTVDGTQAMVKVKGLFDQDEKDDVVSQKLLNRMKFESNPHHLDSGGNQLGGLLIEVGTTYETLKEIQEKLRSVNTDLNEISDLEELDNYARLSVEFAREKLKETLDLTREEITQMFNNLYDEYGNS